MDNENELLQSTAQSWIQRLMDSGAIREMWAGGGDFDAAYEELANMGWLGILIPENYGGAGGSVSAATVVFHELGRGPLPGPVFSSSVLAALAIDRLGTEEQKRELLPSIAAGTLRVAACFMDNGIRWCEGEVGTTVRPDGSSLVLNGTKRFVHDFDRSNMLLCLVREGDGNGVSLALVPGDAEGVVAERVQGFSADLWHVVLTDVRISESDVLGTRGGGWAALESVSLIATPVLASYQAGGCQQIFDITREYTNDRIAFGRPIGRFQRVQDHVVDLSLEADAAKHMTALILDSIDLDGEVAPEILHELKAVASDSYQRACEFSHMVYAGPGTAMEHPLVPHTLMSKMLYQYLGEPAYHKQRMIDLVLAGA